MCEGIDSHYSEFFFSLVENCIEKVLGHNIESLRTKNRRLVYVYPRMIYTKLCINRGASLSDIGRRINKDHSTISSYIAKWDNYYKYDRYFRKMADDVIKEYELQELKNE